MNHALIISDKKPGHVNQSIALCNHLGYSFDIIEISFKSIFFKVISYFLDWLFIYLTSIFKESVKIDKNKYNLIISAGSSTFYANKLISTKYKIKNIGILYPRGYRPSFNYIFAPIYDKYPKKNNIISIPINICHSDEEWFKIKSNEFLKLHHHSLKKAVGIIIGGPNNRSIINLKTLKKQLEDIFYNNSDKEVWITTSRRTTKEIESIISQFKFDYKLIFSDNAYNPIPAFIQLCDTLYITNDSTTMISEAVSYGKSNVFILPGTSIKLMDKFELFYKDLIKRNTVRIFDKETIAVNNKISLNKIIKSKINL